jgi:hypothetical protein
VRVETRRDEEPDLSHDQWRRDDQAAHDHELHIQVEDFGRVDGDELGPRHHADRLDDEVDQPERPRTVGAAADGEWPERSGGEKEPGDKLADDQLADRPDQSLPELDEVLQLDVRRVVEVAARVGVDADSLCRALELPAARIQRALLTLRLRGVLVPGPAGGFVLSNSM